MTKIKKSLINKKNLLICLLIVVVAGAVIAYINKRPQHNSSATDKPKGQDLINLNGPTEEEKQKGDKVKDAIIQQESERNTPPTTTPSGKKSVTPTITYAGQYSQQVEVGGFVAGVFEDGGTCTLNLQKDAITKTVQVASIKDASSVDCPVMAIPTSSLQPGTYQATVSYTSSTSEGVSAARSVEVK